MIIYYKNIIFSKFVLKFIDKIWIFQKYILKKHNMLFDGRGEEEMFKFH